MSDTSRVLRAAVIGLGWAGEQHIKGYQAHQNVQVVALAEPNPTLLEQVRTRYGVAEGYLDHIEMLETEKPDLVSVATPNYLHAQPAIDALDRGAHVLIEKPLARTYAEGLEIVQAAERNDRVMKVTFNQRFRPDVQVMKRFVEEGGLGDVYHAKSRWLRRSGIPGRGRKWFVTREMSGGGPLIDLGVHMLDMALYLMNEPEVLSVSGTVHNPLGQRFVTEHYGENAVFEVEDFATAYLRLSGGRLLLLEASWATYREDGDFMNVLLYGDKGGAEMITKNYDPHHAVRFYVDAGGVPAEITPEVPRRDRTIPGHTQVVGRFVGAVENGEWSDHRGREGLLRTWIIDAIYRSAAEQREIRLAELSPE
jgi:predicted dehydrogenase